MIWFLHTLSLCWPSETFLSSCSSLIENICRARKEEKGDLIAMRMWIWKTSKFWPKATKWEGEIQAVGEQVAETTLDYLNGLQLPQVGWGWTTCRWYSRYLLMWKNLNSRQQGTKIPEYALSSSNLTIAVKWYTFINGLAQSTSAKFIWWQYCAGVSLRLLCMSGMLSDWKYPLFWHCVPALSPSGI